LDTTELYKTSLAIIYQDEDVIWERGWAGSWSSDWEMYVGKIEKRKKTGEERGLYNASQA
jgi:hypothetical protein